MKKELQALAKLPTDRDSLPSWKRNLVPPDRGSDPRKLIKKGAKGAAHPKVRELLKPHDFKRKRKRGRPPKLESVCNVPKVKRALWESSGIISRAAKILKVCPSVLGKFIRRRPEIFEPEIKKIREHFVDIAEDSLIRQVKKENTQATIFLLKCLGKQRGYIDNPQVQLHAHADVGSGTWLEIMRRAVKSGEIKDDSKVIDIPTEVSALAEAVDETEGDGQEQ